MNKIMDNNPEWVCSPAVQRLFTARSQSVDAVFTRAADTVVVQSFWRYAYEAQNHQRGWCEQYAAKAHDLPGAILTADAMAAGLANVTWEGWLMGLRRALAAVKTNSARSEEREAASAAMRSKLQAQPPPDQAPLPLRRYTAPERKE